MMPASSIPGLGQVLDYIGARTGTPDLECLYTSRVCPSLMLAGFVILYELHGKIHACGKRQVGERKYDSQFKYSYNKSLKNKTYIYYDVIMPPGL